MQRSQLGIRLVRLGLRFVVPALITSLPHHPASAQIEVGFGVSLDVIEQPYTIRGSTAQALSIQMRTLSAGAGPTSFRVNYLEWRFTPEQLQGAAGGASLRCRVRDFGVRFDITVTYPVWDRPPNVPPELVDAWESFEDLVEEQREESRHEVIEYGTRMRRQARRVEEDCALVRARLEGVVDRLQAERAEDLRAAAESGRLVRLQWPPPGYQPPEQLDR